MQVTPSVTPTSSLSSGDTRSTYANNVTRGTPNSRGSVDAGHSDVAAAATALEEMMTTTVTTSREVAVVVITSYSGIKGICFLS